jgi:mono/diheme cytochrome c family protein
MLKLQITTGAILGMLATAAVWAAAMLPGDAGHGKKLYDAKCAACHVQLTGGDGSALFTRPNHTVRSVEGLMGRVEGCNRRVNANLSRNDVNDVVKYLNQTYYKFED